VGIDPNQIGVKLKHIRTTGLEMKNAWKDRLYEAYVSSGQANGSHLEPSRHFATRQPYIQRVIRQHITPNRNIRILDLGCGHGAFLYFLQQAGYQDIHGVDVSAEQVEVANRFGIPGVEQQEIGSYLTTVEDETVDVVLLMDVLEHVARPELFDMLDEVFRILRPGGKCIVHVPNASGLYGMQVRYGDLTHELAFTPRSAQQAFSTVGFRHIHCSEDRPIIHGIVSAARWLLWRLGTVPSRLLLAAETGATSFILSQNMLVTALKPDPVPNSPQDP
jgi:2-polyprenyl-3-methyl-5-hydroxy-6-metoxy-1,4-benzoquinol methylase